MVAGAFVGGRILFSFSRWSKHFPCIDSYNLLNSPWRGMRGRAGTVIIPGLQMRKQAQKSSVATVTQQRLTVWWRVLCRVQRARFWSHLYPWASAITGLVI